MDVTEQLLTTPGYDCKVAYATFGESESSASQFYGTTELSNAQDFVTNDIVDYKSNTNYSSGLAQALELVKNNQLLLFLSQMVSHMVVLLLLTVIME